MRTNTSDPKAKRSLIAKSRSSRKLGSLGMKDLIKIDAALKIVLNLK